MKRDVSFFSFGIMRPNRPAATYSHQVSWRNSESLIVLIDTGTLSCWVLKCVNSGKSGSLCSIRNENTNLQFPWKCSCALLTGDTHEGLGIVCFDVE